MVPSSVEYMVQHLSYGGILLLLGTAGFIFPVPEEVVLLSIGYMAALEYFALWPAFWVSLVGVIIGDCFLFWMMQQGGNWIERTALSLAQSRAHRLVEREYRFAGPAVFLLRFVVGLRLLGPFLATRYGMGWGRFLAWDIPAVCIYVSVLFWVGVQFHHTFKSVLYNIEAAQHTLFGLFLLAVLGFVVWLMHGGLLALWPVKKRKSTFAPSREDGSIRQ